MKTKEQPVLDLILAPLANTLTPEVARKIVRLRVDAKTQKKIDRLARRCNDGELTADERADYESFVNANDFVASFQNQARMVLKRHKSL